MAYDGSLKFDTKIDASGFQKGVNGLFGTVSGIAKGTAKVLGGAATAVMGIGTAAVQVGSKFESTMSQVEAISGATGDDLQALKDKAQEMGRATIFSASEAAEGLTYMAMAGWKTQDMLDGLGGIMDLAAASGEDLASTSDIVTDALTAFGMSASDSGRFADVLAAASSNANTNVSMMGETFKYVAPVAGAMGFSVEDCATAIGLMANAGIKGSQAGTALRSLLSRMAKPTKDVANAMTELGVSITDENGDMKSMAQLTEDLRGAFSGLSEAQKAQLASSLAGQEGMSGLLAIVNASEEDYKKLTDAINGSEGAAAAMAKTMQENLQSQVTLLKSGLEGLGLAIYKDLEQPATGAVKSLKGIVEAMTSAYEANGFSGIVQEAGKAFVAMAKEAAKAVPKMVNAATEIVNSFLISFMNQSGSLILAASDMIVSLVDGLLSNMGQITAVGINLVTRLLITLSKQFPKLAQTGGTALKTIADALIKNVPHLATAAIEMVKSLASYVTENLPGMIPAAMEALVTFSGFLRENAGQLFDAGLSLIMGLATALIDNIPVLIETVPTIITNLCGIINDNAPKLLVAGIQLIVKLGMGLIQAIPTLIANIPKIIQAIVAVWSAFNWIQLGKQVITFIVNGVKGMASAIPNALKNIGSKAVSFFKGLNWSNLGSQVINLLVRGVQSLVSAVPNALKAIGSKAMTAFKSISWGSVGSAVVKGIAAGISGGASAIINAAKSAAKKALDSVKNFLGIHSPSHVFRDQVGKMIPAGIGVGIDRGMPVLERNTEKDMAALVKKIQGAVRIEKAVIEEPARASQTRKTDVPPEPEGSGGTTYNQTFNINQPVKSPSETARAIRLEQQYGLAGE